MDFTAEGILARLKSELKNSDSRIEGSFTMDNLQAVSEELARFNTMLLVPLQEELDNLESDAATSGNERHYVKWAKEATNAEGEKIVGNARTSTPRDGTGTVFVAILSTSATSPTEEEIEEVQAYIDKKRPVGANPVVIAAEQTEVQIVCEVQAASGYSAETIQTEIKDDITEYFVEIAFSRALATLNYYKISSIISGADGVSELLDLTINGERGSITADYDKYFSLKELTVNAE